MKKTVLVLLAVLCVLFFGACGLLEKKEAQKPNFLRLAGRLLEKKEPQIPRSLRQVGHLPIWEPDPKDNEWNYVRLSPESRKWCAYAALYNDFAPETAKLLACYRHNFPQGEYVTPKPTFKYATQHMSYPRLERRDGNKALEAATKELPAKPEIDLDKAAAVYVPGLWELWDAAQAAMLRLVVLGRSMSGEYVRQIDKVDARFFHDPKLTGFDLPGFRAAYGELAAAVKDVETYMGDSGQYAKEKIGDSDARAVVDRARHLKKSMTELIQRALADREVLLDHEKTRGMEAKQVVFTPLLCLRTPPIS